MYTNNPLELGYIYVLCDPRTQEIRYVGKTDFPARRYKFHIQVIKSKKLTKRDSWVHTLLSEGLQPEMLILSHIPKEDMQYWEQFWISRLRDLGLDLVNSRNARSPRHTKRILRTATEFAGVFRNGVDGTYKVKIRVNKKTYYLGSYGRDIKLVALLYNIAVQEVFGERAELNLVPEPHPKIYSYDRNNVFMYLERYGLI